MLPFLTRLLGSSHSIGELLRPVAVYPQPAARITSFIPDSPASISIHVAVVDVAAIAVDVVAPVEFHLWPQSTHRLLTDYLMPSLRIHFGFINGNLLLLLLLPGLLPLDLMQMSFVTQRSVGFFPGFLNEFNRIADTAIKSQSNHNPITIQSQSNYNRKRINSNGNERPSIGDVLMNRLARHLTA